MPTETILLFESPPTFKVRALTWFLAAVMILCFVGGMFVYRNMIDDGQPPNLAPLWQRITFAAFIAGVGVVMFASMLFYLTYYVTRLTFAPGSGRVDVETLRLLGRHTRTLDASGILSADAHEGELNEAYTLNVNAPWLHVRVKDSKGFLLDLQGTIHAKDALEKLLGGKPPSGLHSP